MVLSENIFTPNQGLFTLNLLRAIFDKKIFLFVVVQPTREVVKIIQRHKTQQQQLIMKSEVVKKYCETIKWKLTKLNHFLGFHLHSP